MTTPCPRCGFHHNCICDTEPTLACQHAFVLLTHPKEMGKETNTGQLMERSLPHCQRHIWDRVNPPQALLDMLSSPQYQPWLLFPGDDTVPAMPYQLSTSKTPLFILLDATWQEARKMIRRSPWLATLPRLELAAQTHSAYALRRNQQPGNLCTCEAGIVLLETAGFSQDAEQLQQYFNHFIDVFPAEKSGHKK
ncbi:tRNA-uridine aminocarboxypropyltransferase [Photobacterium lutimaris]|uniref:tRNA-uridine aminocarboxypropyltransferase n=1 Tax=Photobacterium lutimaris TaxID=388278 RepID=A0A2T3IWP0_9GAMM|nr:DTW domain-containing protein [Photobacterium lutimaris]PSU32901.1 DTW domain-containing protein [Photobacterium lutimaris]TDR74113.1 DTW domain-containing protein YfiP [Photobacterium lutimaris]